MISVYSATMKYENRPMRNPLSSTPMWKGARQRELDRGDQLGRGRRAAADDPAADRLDQRADAGQVPVRGGDVLHLLGQRGAVQPQRVGQLGDRRPQVDQRDLDQDQANRPARDCPVLVHRERRVGGAAIVAIRVVVVAAVAIIGVVVSWRACR
jgi:hypothetical protein